MPVIYHPTVIKLAIKNKVNVVTTSYVSSEIKELEEAAQKAGIVVLNEVGADPGVDHLYAIKKIEEVQRHELTELFRKLSPLRLNCWEIRKGTQECRSPLE